MKLYSYNNGSDSAKALSKGLNIKLIKHGGKDFKMKGVLINWGCSKIDRTLYGFQSLLNSPGAVGRAVNKLTAFQAMKETVSVPAFTESRDEAVEWLAEGCTVVVRNKLNGHSGQGIEIVEPAEGAGGLGLAPLYVKYIKKSNEYRLHVFQDEVFFIQKKARKLDVPDDKVNWQVRNHANGFIYANQDVVVPEKAYEEAINAVKAVGLDFGAVDLIETAKGKIYVLEVNTACGLEGATLQAYIDVFNQFKGV